MITVSVCMIVKNEEAVLARCLDSLCKLVEEIIIVDTGSTDQTKQIAKQYTDQVYDYAWSDNFAEARNFAFSKAHMDYIYSADADEVLDEENQKKFLLLKQAMLPEIEIVQMHYLTDMRFNTTENYVRDIRPKLYKRIRSFTWIDPVHEMVNLDPVVYDSDIEIQHLPISKHQKRDFSIFEKMIERGEKLSERLLKMYARELYLSGEAGDFEAAQPYFLKNYYDYMKNGKKMDDVAKMLAAVLCKGAYLNRNDRLLTKIALQDLTTGSSAEVCFVLGEYYFSCKEYEDALQWYQCAAHSTESFLDVHSSGDDALLSVARVLEFSEDETDRQQAIEYRQMALVWKSEHGFSIS